MMPTPTRCALCGSARPPTEVREHYSQDYRGQRIVVFICVDATACIARAVAGYEPRIRRPS